MTRALTHAEELDRYVFQRLPALAPYYMADEDKWLVMYPSEEEHEAERFDTQESARRFADDLRTGRQP